MSRPEDRALEEYMAGLLSTSGAPQNDSSVDGSCPQNKTGIKRRDDPVARFEGEADASLPRIDEPDLAWDERQRVQRLLATAVSLKPQSAEPPVATQVPDAIQRTLRDDPDGVLETTAPVAPSLDIQCSETHSSTQTQAEKQPNTWASNGRPLWAQTCFDVLLMRVNGLTLGAPLTSLGQIYKMDKKLTSLFGQSEWFMGVFSVKGKKFFVLNTALYVMPEHYSAAWLEGDKFLVTIDGCEWGFAVDEITQPGKIDPDDVNWRSRRAKRPWLAGTIKSAMCALLDVPGMRIMLTAS